ncbi:MAG: peptidylprolyl isomerase [Pseudomonadota bacterium]|nr:peptidylprolyl isomerase [Pseudomonadota bacterium]
MKMPRLLRLPLLHFLLLGSALLLVEQQFAVEEPAATAAIHIDSREIAGLSDDWQQETGVAPNATQLKASIERHVDDELLMAEALRLDLDQTDPVARARLLQNMRFAFPQRRASDASLLHEARIMDMSRRDLVVRRRLIQVMERRLAANVAYDEQSFAEYLQLHTQRYGQPARIAFRQFFFNASDSAIIERARNELARGAVVPDTVGDAFLHGQVFPPLSMDEITQRFGAEFATVLQAQPAGQWVGPLHSAYGSHLVEITQRVDAQPVAGEKARNQALRAWIAAQQPQQMRAALKELRERYEVQLPADYAQRAAGSGA